MQLSNLSNNNCDTKNHKSNIKQAQPSFGSAGGFAAPFVTLANFIESNGFLGEFLTVDTFGMAAPRTIQGYNRNKKELGHPNYKAGFEEFVREALSGPAFFFVPAIVLATSALLKGKSTKVTTNTLEAFHGIMKNASKNITNLKDSKNIKENFLNSFTENVFVGYEHKTENINKIKTILADTLDKKIPKDKARKEIEETLTTLNKANGKFVDDTTKIKIGEKDLSISDLISDIPNYLEDFTNKSQKASESTTDFIEKFHKNSSMVRKTTNILAAASLSAFLVLIPKLYQTDKKFPGLEGLDTSNPRPKKHYHKDIDEKNKQNVSFSGNHGEKAGKTFFNWLAEKCNIGNHGDLTREAFLAISGIFMVGSRFKDSRGADERREVLTRDIPGILLAVAGAPVLNNTMAYAITKKTGIPINQFVENKVENLKKGILSIFKPKNEKSIRNARFVSQKQVKDWYTNFKELKNPIVTFAETIERHGGNIKKVMKKLGLDNELKALHSNENATNKEIIEALKKGQSAGSKEFKAIEEKLVKLPTDNAVFKFAQKAQASVKIGGLLFTAALLGVIIPRLNIVITKKKYQGDGSNPQQKPEEKTSKA